MAGSKTMIPIYRFLSAVRVTPCHGCIYFHSQQKQVLPRVWAASCLLAVLKRVISAWSRNTFMFRKPHCCNVISHRQMLEKTHSGYFNSIFFLELAKWLQTHATVLRDPQGDKYDLLQKLKVTFWPKTGEGCHLCSDEFSSLAERTFISTVEKEKKVSQAGGETFREPVEMPWAPWLLW